MDDSHAAEGDQAGVEGGVVVDDVPQVDVRQDMLAQQRGIRDADRRLDPVLGAAGPDEVDGEDTVRQGGMNLSPPCVPVEMAPASVWPLAPPMVSSARPRFRKA
jgi:hypothetical protein